MPHFILYRSFSVYGEFHISDLDIIRTAIRHNASCGITGFLRRERGIFLQYLEGDAAPVRELAGAIRRDRRHFEMEILAQGQTDARAFEGWSMGYGTKHGRGLAVQLGVPDLGRGPLPTDGVRAAMQAQAKAQGAPLELRD